MADAGDPLFRRTQNLTPGNGRTMDPMLPFDVLSRWFHVGFAIILVGGSFFIRYVLQPSAQELPDEAHQQLRQAFLGRWRRIVGMGIGLLLITGFFNYYRGIKSHPGQPIYHALIGTKMLLAFGVFFLGSALAGRSPKFEPIRQNSRKWLGVLLLLAAIIVAISGYVKVAVKPSAVPQTETGKTAQAD